MADQKVKVYYKPTNPNSGAIEATEADDVKERHEERRELNRQIRAKSSEPRSLSQSAKETFSSKNIMDTAAHVGRKLPGAVKTGIQNVGNRVLEITRAPSSPPSLPKQRSKSRASASPEFLLSPAWTRGSPIPSQFLRIPDVTTASPLHNKKHKKQRAQEPRDTRPEWIRF